MEIHGAALRHGVGHPDIHHATDHVLVEYEIDEDPTKVLAIGPDRAGNLLEIVALHLGDGGVLVIHAMPLRSTYLHLLPEGDANA